MPGDSHRSTHPLKLSSIIDLASLGFPITLPGQPHQGAQTQRHRLPGPKAPARPQRERRRHEWTDCIPDQEGLQVASPPKDFAVSYKSMRSKNLSLAVVMASSAALCFAPNPAETLTFPATVNGVTYDVTSFTGSYNANASKFNAINNGGLMSWWDSASLATAFASQLPTQFGKPYYGVLGPHFGYSLPIDESDGDYINTRFYTWVHSIIDPNY